MSPDQPPQDPNQISVNMERLLRLTQAKLLAAINEAAMWETAYWELKNAPSEQPQLGPTSSPEQEIPHAN